jgi:hypothetical protein
MHLISKKAAPFVVILLLLLTSAVAAAQSGGHGKGPIKNKPQRARITWSQPRIVQSVAPGQTVTVDVSLTSSADIATVTLRVPGGLGRVLKVEPASFSLKAGVATPVKLTVTMPANGAHSQGGVVQVRAGRNIPASLKVLVQVPGSTHNKRKSAD